MEKKINSTIGHVGCSEKKNQLNNELPILHMKNDLRGHTHPQLYRATRLDIEVQKEKKIIKERN